MSTNPVVVTRDRRILIKTREWLAARTLGIDAELTDQMVEFDQANADLHGVTDRNDYALHLCALFGTVTQTDSMPEGIEVLSTTLDLIGLQRDGQWFALALERHRGAAGYCSPTVYRVAGDLAEWALFEYAAGCEYGHSYTVRNQVTVAAASGDCADLLSPLYYSLETCVRLDGPKRQVVCPLCQDKHDREGVPLEFELFESVPEPDDEYEPPVAPVDAADEVALTRHGLAHLVSLLPSGHVDYAERTIRVQLIGEAALVVEHRSQVHRTRMTRIEPDGFGLYPVSRAWIVMATEEADAEATVAHIEADAVREATTVTTGRASLWMLAGSEPAYVLELPGVRIRVGTGGDPVVSVDRSGAVRPRVEVDGVRF